MQLIPIPAEASTIEVRNTVLNRIMLRVYEPGHDESIALDMRLNATEARTLAAALNAAADEQDKADAVSAHAGSRPSRQAPMIDIFDWFVADVRIHHPEWDFEKVAERAEQLATGWAR
jgi:hypothetical protein